MRQDHPRARSRRTLLRPGAGRRSPQTRPRLERPGRRAGAGRTRRGASWEGFVVGQILDFLGQLGVRHEPHYFRTSDGWEVDLVLELGGKRWAFEIRLTASPSTEDVRRLDRAAALLGADVRVLLSRTDDPVEQDGRISCNLPWLLRRLRGEASTS
jgi:predicted AAA+ superfamily ATPase